MMKIAIILFSILSLSVKGGVGEIFEGKTSIKKPFEMRDPFQAPKFKTVKKNNIKSKKADGVFDNRARLNSVGNYTLDDLTIVGVIIGKERRVSVKVGQKSNVFFLKEGDKLGKNNAEIKAILPGGIILVEKVSNIYGEDEFIETVIPISR